MSHERTGLVPAFAGDQRAARLCPVDDPARVAADNGLAAARVPLRKSEPVGRSQSELVRSDSPRCARGDACNLVRGERLDRTGRVLSDSCLVATRACLGLLVSRAM